jgi:thioredoxin 1
MLRCGPVYLLLSALTACSSPDVGPVEKRAPAPPPEPSVAETDRPDAGAPAPLPVLQLARPMLVDITREDCLPCKLMAPWLIELRARHAGAIEVLEVSLDRPENRELALFFKARSVPTQVYVDAGGREVGRDVGLATLPQMESRLEKLGFLKKD